MSMRAPRYAQEDFIKTLTFGTWDLVAENTQNDCFRGSFFLEKNWSIYFLFIFIILENNQRCHFHYRNCVLSPTVR